MFRFFRKIRRKRWPSLEASEIRKRARLLVVDDSDFPYQELFARDGYSVDKWDDVQDLTKLEDLTYDLILLDIQGVGLHESKEEGLGILRHIKKVSPAQIVIAFSTADFSLDKKEFFDLADDSLSKGEDYVNFKRSVDQLLEKRFSLGFYVDRIIKLTSPESSDIEAIREAAEDSILIGDISLLEKALNKIGLDKETANTALQVAQIGVAIAAL